MAKKTRVDIPRHVAARVLFLSNRTCCVCRQRGKPVQIHHVDEDPSHSTLDNLAVLCFDCHRDTQIRGGFDRKLDADQVLLYRDDWHTIVSRQRAAGEGARELIDESVSDRLELATSLAETYRENGEFELLAIHYHSIGNEELRDKYINLVLSGASSDETVCFLRGLQQRPDLIPPEVLQRELDRYERVADDLQKARLLLSVRRYREAAISYLRGILNSLEAGNHFSAAYYLKEAESHRLTNELFILALADAQEEEDLWWQVRCYQELNWHPQLQQFLLDHRDDIEASGNPDLKCLLADASGDVDRATRIRKAIANAERADVHGIASLPIDDSELS